MHRDPKIFPKIVELRDQHGIDSAEVIALLAVNALADMDLSSLAFWAALADTANDDGLNKAA